MAYNTMPNSLTERESEKGTVKIIFPSLFSASVILPHFRILLSDSFPLDTPLIRQIASQTNRQKERQAERQTQRAVSKVIPGFSGVFSRRFLASAISKNETDALQARFSESALSSEQLGQGLDSLTSLRSTARQLNGYRKVGTESLNMHVRKVDSSRRLAFIDA